MTKQELIAYVITQQHRFNISDADMFEALGFLAALYAHEMKQPPLETADIIKETQARIIIEKAREGLQKCRR